MTTAPAPFPLHRVPWLLLAAVTALLLIGLSAIERGDELRAESSASRRESGEKGNSPAVASLDSELSSLDSSEKQLVWIALGVPVFIVAAGVPYRSLLRFSYPLLAVTLVLLVAVYFTPPRNGARRWIPLGVILLQPSEIAKPAFILALAAYLRFRENFRTLPGLVPPFLTALVPMGLILVEPDLGTSLLFVPVLGAMLFAAGARPRHLALVAAVGVLLTPVLWTEMDGYQKVRVVAVFTQSDSGPPPRGHGYHLHQSKTMLALGGMWGSEIVGMASSDPLDYHLPAGRTDFIFCLVGERWGLAGCGVTLALYALLFHRGVAVAKATKEPFGRLLVVGIVAMLATQTAINTSMTVGLVPITGITLPLLSYGGSSLIATLGALGLVVNVALRPGYEVGPMPFRFEE
ncbi:MAG: FtsW/RodA/SpoVE family cell cycle protein [Planctomycetaceae bacterium]